MRRLVYLGILKSGTGVLVLRKTDSVVFISASHLGELFVLDVEQCGRTIPRFWGWVGYIVHGPILIKSSSAPLTRLEDTTSQ